jgi:hypothetical protein
MPNKRQYRLIHPSAEVTASLCDLSDLCMGWLEAGATWVDVAISSRTDVLGCRLWLPTLRGYEGTFG